MVSAIAVVSYLVGSIPTGYLMAQARGVDIRKVGSGNIGATNVFRILGKTAGVTVLLLDALKGFIPPFFVPFLFHLPAFENVERYAMVSGLFAIIGHNYTCWLRFKGGKGIATTAGVLIALTPNGFLVALATWLIVLWVSKYVSLASVIAAAVLPIAIWLTGGSQRMIILGVVFGALAIYKHKPNIQRLLAGTENRFGQKKETGASAK
jgi:acyl phosphate:glycerol-3-phosphate acyltransferase